MEREPYLRKRGGVWPQAVVLYDTTAHGNIPARRVDVVRTGKKTNEPREYIPAW